jgi:hypothetical protein
MWEPRRLTTLWAFTACYRDSLTLTMAMFMKCSFDLQRRVVRRQSHVSEEHISFIFDPEDGDNMFLRTTRCYNPESRALRQDNQ